jgi:hypothetical protein
MSCQRASSSCCTHTRLGVPTVPARLPAAAAVAALADCEEHMRWMYDKALARASEFGIQVSFFSLVLHCGLLRIVVICYGPTGGGMRPCSWQHVAVGFLHR